MVTKYVCPMDGSTSDTEGKCSKCGTGMVKITEKIDTHATKGSQPKTKIVTKYVCPMDGSTSDKPGECPKCGMEMAKTEGKKK
ncbi:heavy metal-binding domain-containing protein [Flavobacterium sp. SOK18b]|uniref:heavy metal-binding domain-containing protein n=1 Tax=Flavobacterium sp. SOK18b TaxID=797900 RepID=UPI00351DA048